MEEGIWVVLTRGQQVAQSVHMMSPMRGTGFSIRTQTSDGRSHILGELGSDLGRSQTTEKNVLDQLLQDPLLWETLGTIQPH